MAARRKRRKMPTPVCGRRRTRNDTKTVPRTSRATLKRPSLISRDGRAGDVRAVRRHRGRRRPHRRPRRAPAGRGADYGASGHARKDTARSTPWGTVFQTPRTATRSTPTRPAARRRGGASSDRRSGRDYRHNHDHKRVLKPPDGDTMR